MKRMIALLLAICLLAATLMACGGKDTPTEAPTESTAPPTTEPTQTEEPSAESTEGTEETEESVTEEIPTGPYQITTSYANAYRNSLGEVWVQAVIAVKNTSETPLCLDYSDVTVHVSEEETQELSYVMAFPNIIAPGETGYYYEEVALNYEATGLLDVTADLVITEVNELHERYTVTNVTLADSRYGGLQMRGTVEDPNAQEGKLIYIAAILFDAEDKPLVVCSTIHTETDATSAEFELISFMLPETITADMVARFETYAYPFHLEAAQ